MNKSTLYTIGDILKSLDTNINNLHSLLDLLNLTPDERIRIEDALLVTLSKIDKIKESPIRDLDQHVHVDYIEKYLNHDISHKNY